MLQTRLENEQFGLLPVLYTNSRSRHDFLNSDRPDSAQLVDLHVYIIPKSIWKNLQHLAENEAMDDAISAGFVRVSPEMKLFKLRESIEMLCGRENFFPREFIFLRSVGRNLTRVKPSQEDELKVKHYRPPQTPASEIYVLEGRHEDYGNIPSVSPALSSASYVFGRYYRYRVVPSEYGQESSRLSRYFHQKPVPLEKDFNQIRRRIRISSQVPSADAKSWTKFTSNSSDTDERTPNLSVMTSATSRELNKLKEEQERLRQRQADLERMRRAVEEKKLLSDREEGERQRRQKEKEEEEEEEEERRKRKLEKERQEEEDEERRRRQKEKDEHEQEERERKRRRRRQEKDEAERKHREKLEVAATRIQASFRGFKDRQTFRERQRNSEILSRSSIESTSDLDSSVSRPETRTINKEFRQSIQTNSSSLISMKTERKIRSNPSSVSYTITTTEEHRRAATVTKFRQSDEENDDDDEKTYEIKRRRDLSEERRKPKETVKPKQPRDLESLRLRLQELRTGRNELEKVRDEIIKNLKFVHQRVTLRRKEARDMWKKKYFQEKKKTSPIEGKVTQLKTDLDLIHSKIIQIIDNECKHSAQVGCLRDAETGNLILQIVRTQHETQHIRQQLDQAKLRLTTDLKLRNQAESECKLLKHELNQAKMNLNHIRNRLTS